MCCAGKRSSRAGVKNGEGKRPSTVGEHAWKLLQKAMPNVHIVADDLLPVQTTTSDQCRYNCVSRCVYRWAFDPCLSQYVAFSWYVALNKTSDYYHTPLLGGDTVIKVVRSAAAQDRFFQRELRLRLKAWWHNMGVAFRRATHILAQVLVQRARALGTRCTCRFDNIWQCDETTFSS